MIKVTHLTKSFSGQKVLDDLTVTIEKVRSSPWLVHQAQGNQPSLEA